MFIFVLPIQFREQMFWPDIFDKLVCNGCHLLLLHSGPIVRIAKAEWIMFVLDHLDGLDHSQSFNEAVEMLQANLLQNPLSHRLRRANVQLGHALKEWFCKVTTCY